MNEIQSWLLRVPKVLTFLLVIALGFTLAKLLWLVLTPPTSVAQAATLVLGTKKTPTIRQENYGKLIADQHIFGAIAKAAPKKVIAPTAPTPKKVAPVVTELKLELSGIIAAKGSGGGFAMLSYNSGTQEVYKRGEAIPKKVADEPREIDGVSLKYVGNNYVLIDNNGTEQRVELPDLSASKTGSSATQATSRSTSSRLKPRDLSRTMPSLAGNASLNATNTSGQAQSLAELREQAMDDPSKLLSVITPSLVRKDGAVSGIRVYPSRNRALFRELGLRNGDIITKINDIVIDDPNKGMEIFQQISGASSLTIHVTRGGNEEILTPSF